MASNTMALSVHLSAFRDGNDDDDDNYDNDGDDEDEDEYDAKEGEEEGEHASAVGYVVVADDDDKVLCGETRGSVICIMSFNQIVSI